MDCKYIEQLLERYWQCETSLEEEAQLCAFFNGSEVPEHLLCYKDLFVYQQLQQEVGLGADFDARVLAEVESALDAWWALSSIFSGGMLGLFLLGYISKKARNVDAVLGVICGIIVVVWMSLSPIFFKDGFMSEYTSPFHANLTIVFGTIVIFLAGFLSMRLLKTKK